MATKTMATWQEELAEECRKRNITAPSYNIVSDRRGGRTAWSATVTVSGQNIAARYWYDGQFLNNAKEDAAEVACTRIRSPAITTSSQTPGYRGGGNAGNTGGAGLGGNDSPSPYAGRGWSH